MLITFRKTRTNTQAMVSLPKHIIEMWGVDENSTRTERTVEVVTDGDRIIIKKVGGTIDKTE